MDVLPYKQVSVHGITSDGGIYDLFQPCNEIISTMMQNSDKKFAFATTQKHAKAARLKFATFPTSIISFATAT